MTSNLKPVETWCGAAVVRPFFVLAVSVMPVNPPPSDLSDPPVPFNSSGKRCVVVVVHGC